MTKRSARSNFQSWMALAALGLSISVCVLLIIIADSLPSVLIGILGLLAWIILIWISYPNKRSAHKTWEEQNLDYLNAREYARMDAENTLTIFDSQKKD